LQNTYRVYINIKMLASRVLRSRSATFAVSRRFMGGYEQPPLSQGKGGKPNVVPSDDDQATGREREELKALAKGIEYFNRQPVRMQKGQGTFENPVLVPSQEADRIVGIVPKGQDGPIWFEITNEAVHYVPDVDLHFKLYDPLKGSGAAAPAKHH
jgi:hypothetical protein